jgi:hypothetical protein
MGGGGGGAMDPAALEEMEANRRMLDQLKREQEEYK